jgi:glutamate-1-semialdehyde 2,1-aminomutase
VERSHPGPSLHAAEFAFHFEVGEDRDMENSRLNHDRSESLFAKAAQLFPGGVNSPVRAFGSVGGTPFFVDRGEGAYLIDVDGNRYVDYINSWGPLVLGHAHPAVVDAISVQAARGTSFGACHALEADLAETIQHYYPSVEMMRFTSSGTEAGMAVIRLARGFTRKMKIVKFEGCYHGHGDALLAKAGSGVLTLGLPGSAGVPQEVTANTCIAQFNDLASVEAIFDQDQGKDIAAVIIEPVVGNCGILVPEPGFLQGLRTLTERYGSLLIFDEVMTGFRVDMRGAQGLYGVRPDLSMFGKVIGGGLPVGAFGGRREIMQQIAPSGPVYQAGTLSGNPLAMAAGKATLAEWGKPGIFEQTARSTKLLVSGLRAAADHAGIPLVAESVGTMFGFFFSRLPVKTYSDTKQADAVLFNRFFHLMLDRGVYFAPSAFEAGFVSSAHSGAPIDETIANATEVFDLMARGRAVRS